MRGVSSFAVVTVLGLLAPSAWGQDRDPLTADALFETARQSAESGNYAAACPKFAESYRLDPAPGTLLNIGDCEERLGHIATAWINYRKAIDLLPPKDARVAFAKKKVAALDKRIARLTVKLAAGDPSGTVVKRDGVEISASALGIAIPTDPGKHVVFVTAPGRREHKYEIDLAEGESREVVGEPLKEDVPPAVAPVPVPSAPPAKAAAPELKPPKPVEEPAPPAIAPTSVAPTPAPMNPPSTPAPDQDDGSGRRTGGYVVGAVGVGGLVIGVITRALAFGQKSIIDNHCGTNKLCDQTGLDAVSAGGTLLTVSTVSLIVGGAAVVTGTALVLGNPAPSMSQATLTPLILPGGAGLNVGGRF
jgi:hypothetical protein